MLFESRVQQRLSMSRNKRLTNLIDESNSLAGLDIDWHLANAEMGFDNFVAPIQNDQPAYAYTLLYQSIKKYQLVTLSKVTSSLSVTSY